jgi:uncharacterized protein YukE
MGRPTGWDVVDQGSDPVAGDPSVIRAMSREYRRISDAADDAATRLKSVQGSGWLTDWQGDAADVFVDAIKDTPSDLHKLVESYSRAASALSGWADTVDDTQYRADGALADAKDAAGDLTRAQSRLSSAENTLTHYQSTASSLARVATTYPAGSTVPSGVDVPTASQLKAAHDNTTVAASSVSSAQGDVSAAQSRIDAAKRLVAAAKGDWQDGEQRTATALGDAADAGLGKQSFWSKLFHSQVWEDIVTVAKVVVAVGGIIAMIIPGPWTLIIAAVALIVLADTIYKMTQGQANGWDLAFALLDCVPAAGALGTAAKGVKVVEEGAQAVSTASKVAHTAETGEHVVEGATTAVESGNRVRRTLKTVDPELRQKVLDNPIVKNRPGLRKATKLTVIEDAERTRSGDFVSEAAGGRNVPAARDADGAPIRVNPETGKPDPDGMTTPEPGSFQYGHKPGYEWSETRIRATEEGWSRAKLIEHENDPSHYRLEDPADNMGHQNELQPGESLPGGR